MNDLAIIEAPTGTGMTDLALAKPREFEPSPVLVEMYKRIRRLNRNIARASTFRPRLLRRARLADAAFHLRFEQERAAFEKGSH